MRTTLVTALAVISVACGDDRLPAGDGGTTRDGSIAGDGSTTRDGGTGSDGAMTFDGATTPDGAPPLVDAMLPDAPTPDGGVIADAGPTTCAPSSCEARACGRSPCGYPCGDCPMGFYCGASGSCIDRAVTPPPGDFCVDAFGELVVEGGRSFRTCPVDDAELQSCLCSGGGPSAWIMCGDCVVVRLDGPRGARCATDAQCGGGVPCHPFIHLCGERCDRGGPAVVCPTGTACGVPGDIAGVCLPECATCGVGCSESATCRRGIDGENVCVPNNFGWATSCPP